MTDKIRLFTALSIPGDLRAQLEALPRKGIEASWTHPDDYHITLRFLGDVTEDHMPAIEEALTRARRPVFRVEAGGLDFFENKKQSILQVPVLSTRKMEALCAEITDALAPFSFDFGSRLFVPHITVARVKNAKGLESYAHRYGPRIRAGWDAAAFHLMRSASSPGGGRYTALKTYPLEIQR